MREPCIIGIGFRRDSSLSTNIELVDRVRTMVDSVGDYDDEPSSCRDVSWALSLWSVDSEEA